MDKLSQELIDHITSYFHPYLDKQDLKQMLTVSKAFQYSVERIVLAHCHLTEDKADDFLRRYNGERIHYLRYVQFLPTFPMADGDRNPDVGCREKSDELLEKDKIFTRQIGVLFRTLKCLEDRAGTGRTRGKLHLTIFAPRRAVKDYPCRHLACVCWRVHLLHPETLPRLSSIHTLEFKDAVFFYPPQRGYRDPDAFELHASSKLDLRILVDLASKITSLRQLTCNFDTYFGGMNSAKEVTRHFSQDWAGPHRDTRHDFARLLDSITLSSLESLNLDFHCSGDKWRDQQKILPNLIAPQHYDPFSTSLRVLSYKLKTMILRVTADQTLFWPTDSTTTPCWPNLEYIDVFFCDHSPSGEEYFQGPQGEGSDTSPGYEITQAHYEPMEANATDRYYDGISTPEYGCSSDDAQFRIVPIDKTLRPLLVAFAKAANKMPSLRKALLRTGLEFCPSDVYDYYEDLSTEISDAAVAWKLGWGIAYAKPGEDIEMKGIGHKDCASRQFWWMTQDWRPDASLHSLFDKIGQFQHGNEAIHHWGSAQGQKWFRGSLFDGLIERAVNPLPEPKPDYIPV
jgi:hypothetical protein